MLQRVVPSIEDLLIHLNIDHEGVIPVSAQQQKNFKYMVF